MKCVKAKLSVSLDLGVKLHENAGKISSKVLVLLKETFVMCDSLDCFLTYISDKVMLTQN